mmetsp:Transcript_81051/g.135625  ORF Transcript_81051/g.135625 Transcript_81051/m.135625 type:complete len:98 (+) Transcript_81051:118-411(+)
MKWLCAKNASAIHRLMQCMISPCSGLHAAAPHALTHLYPSPPRTLALSRFIGQQIAHQTGQCIMQMISMALWLKGCLFTFRLMSACHANVKAGAGIH